MINNPATSNGSISIWRKFWYGFLIVLLVIFQLAWFELFVEKEMTITDQDPVTIRRLNATTPFVFLHIPKVRDMHSVLKAVAIWRSHFTAIQ